MNQYVMVVALCFNFDINISLICCCLSALENLDFWKLITIKTIMWISGPFILFYFILFYFILLYFALFYFILFYLVLFYLISSYFILFHLISCYVVILSYFISFYFILLYFILFYFILFYSRNSVRVVPSPYKIGKFFGSCAKRVFKHEDVPASRRHAI
jgi:hypothetical protein